MKDKQTDECLTDDDDEGIVCETLKLEGNQNLHVICAEKNTD